MKYEHSVGQISKTQLSKQHRWQTLNDLYVSSNTIQIIETKQVQKAQHLHGIFLTLQIIQLN